MSEKVDLQSGVTVESERLVDLIKVKMDREMNPLLIDLMYLHYTRPEGLPFNVDLLMSMINFYKPIDQPPFSLNDVLRCYAFFVDSLTKTEFIHWKRPPPPHQNPEREYALVADIMNHKLINADDPVEGLSSDSPLVTLPTKVSPNLMDQLDKLMKGVRSPEDLKESTDNIKVEIGTSCKNSACKKSYEGPESNAEECLFHPGAPIFHEGMKFWSCCKRRTTDFETFLSQEGCESGKHVWHKAEPKIDSDESRRTSCRFDWHQTGNDVVLTIYSKLPIPDKCAIKANQTKLEIKITFNGQEEKLFIHNFSLFSAIDTDKSSVEFTHSKVEICLRKADKSYWKNLSQ